MQMIMEKVRKYFRKVIEILSLKELRILPAYLSYSFVLAIMPIITIIVIVAGFFSISIDMVIDILNDLLPNYASRIVVGAISGESFDFNVGILNVITFVIAANGMYAVILASNSLYRIDNSSVIRDRIKSFIILVIIILLLLFLILFPMLGDKILDIFSNYELFKNIDIDLQLIYKAIKWPLTFLIIFFNIKIIYKIAPSKNIRSDETTVGAFVTTVGWALFTGIFGYYINYFGRYDLIYGGLSNIIILLIWIYVLSFILILGIVVNTMKYNKS